MMAALAATGIWSVSSLASSRGARHLGGISANLVRLGVALPLLLLGAVLAGTAPLQAAHGSAGTWFLWSGVVGMGLCDILVLSAYARLGARVTTLVVNACAAPAATVIGLCWLGEHPGPGQTAAILAILAGVVLVLRPRAGDRFDAVGVACALAGGIMFAGSAVMSRVGFAAAIAAGAPIHWLDTAVLRVAAGTLLCLLAFVVTGPFAPRWRDGPGRWRQGVPWLALNAALGPGAGLVCYQWALTTTSAAELHAMIAVIPVLVMVATWVTGEERPDRLSICGTVLAVAGVALLALLRGG